MTVITPMETNHSSTRKSNEVDIDLYNLTLAQTRQVCKTLLFSNIGVGDMGVGKAAAPLIRQHLSHFRLHSGSYI